ncbi:MAG TPA: hypothetical protein VK141_03810 [Nitrosomonas sp.]|nr:hypothetical protein [Nitrosomonas sp.]
MFGIADAIYTIGRMAVDNDLCDRGNGGHGLAEVAQLMLFDGAF